VEVPEETAGRVTRLYARQSRLIDEGYAEGWAATFTADGEFHSPSYPEPYVGTAALVAFAERYAEAQAGGTVSRHVVTNVDVLPGEGDSLTVHAYLQIVATPRGEQSRLVRMTTITDRLVPAGDTWLVAHRQVRRDDA
jgi:3-phenylpropionate/cinnamic acid dioxygenase small subunit